MPLTEAEAIVQVAQIMRRTFGLKSEAVIDRATTAAGVDGWDSVSHAVLIMALEDWLELELPLEQTLEAHAVGDLIDIVVRESAR